MIEFSNEALGDLRSIQEYIARANPAVAARQARRIINSLKTLEQFPKIGREGREAATREISIPPWIAVYRIDGIKILIVHIWHGAQSRESS